MKKITIIFLSFALLFSHSFTQNMRPLVTNITSQYSAQNSQVTISWNTSEDARVQISELLVYKNAGSILSSEVLSILAPIATLSAEDVRYTDTINDFKSYYYAVVARTNNGSLYDVIIPTVNATAISVQREPLAGVAIAPQAKEHEVKEEPSSEINTNIQAPLRQRPLPYLDVSPNNERVESGPITDVNQNSANTQNAFYLHSHILDEDINGESATGDDYTLFTIVNSVIAQENWEAAQEELTSFLQVNRSAGATARANYYLGQSYYFLHEYRTALTYFQRSERFYPVQSKKWIEEVLNLFSIS